MLLILFFSASALCTYTLGYLVGKWTTEQKVEQARQEMQIDDGEADPYDELFK